MVDVAAGEDTRAPLTILLSLIKFARIPMKILPLGITLAVSLCVVLSGCATSRRPAAENRISFALIGDVPYSANDAAVSFPNMIEEINRAHVAFTVHDGDIKSGSEPCSEQALEAARRQFQTFDSPFIYLFGDNEWTDCGRSPTNVISPEGWLDRLREVFTKGDQSLGKRTLTLERQSNESRFTKYRENVRWTLGNVLFVGLNLPGDANNFGQNEFAERNLANLAWISDGFAYARSNQMRAIMLILQANPHFELAATNRLRLGFNEFLTLIEKETIAFKKPVLFVHGDSHYFRIDKPLMGRKSKRRLENFTRVETFGYPDVHWVQATIDEHDPNVFVFEPRIVGKNLVKQE
jgi:hypothetical protein